MPLKRGICVCVRMTASERNFYGTAATRAGLTITPWIRRAIEQSAATQVQVCARCQNPPCGCPPRCWCVCHEKTAASLDRKPHSE